MPHDVPVSVSLSLFPFLNILNFAPFCQKQLTLRFLFEVLSVAIFQETKKFFFYKSIYLARNGYISWFSETNFYLLHKQHFKGIHHICHIHIFKWAEPLTSILNLPISLLTCLFFVLESSILSLCETANECPDQSQVKSNFWRPIPQVTINCWAS